MYLELPPLKQPLSELVRRQQSGRPLDDTQSAPLLDRKQGHWPGLSLTDVLFNSQAEAKVRKQRSTVAGQRQKTSAAIVTQKTTLPQIETIGRRDHEYQVRCFSPLNSARIFLPFVLVAIQGSVCRNSSTYRQALCVHPD